MNLSKSLVILLVFSFFSWTTKGQTVHENVDLELPDFMKISENFYQNNRDSVHEYLIEKLSQQVIFFQMIVKENDSRLTRSLKKKVEHSAGLVAKNNLPVFLTLGSMPRSGTERIIIKNQKLEIIFIPIAYCLISDYESIVASLFNEFTDKYLKDTFGKDLHIIMHPDHPQLSSRPLAIMILTTPIAL